MASGHSAIQTGEKKMDPLLGINPNASVAGILASPAVTPSYALLSAQLSLSTPALFGYSSTMVGISARGQILSASVTFQNALRPLKSGTTEETVDLAEFTTRAQSLVDAFNTLQSTIAVVDKMNLPSSGSITTASDLSRSLDAQALNSYTNGGATLTDLSQLGIELQPDIFPAGSSRLTLDTDKLEAAFTSDAQSATALLASAADAFSTVAGNFISRSGSQFPSFEAFLQTTSNSDLLAGLPQLQTLSLHDALASQSEDQTINWQLVYAAITEYSLVSQLYG